MSKLWTFGDSFISPENRYYDTTHYPEWHWVFQLGKKLGVSGLSGAALPGVSNEWISYQIMQNINNINKDDFIVIVTTSMNRRWFIKDKPMLSNLYITNLHEHMSRDSYRAIDLYKQEFNEQHEFLSKIYYEQFLTWIRSVLEPYQYCLIPGFDATTLHHTSNNIPLVKADEGEFIDGYDRKLFATWEGWDRRLSHLSECNHDVLSDKITRFFNTNELIDLSTEFKKNLFTCKQDCLDYNLDISI